MELFSSISPLIYPTIYNCLVFGLCMIVVMRNYSVEDNTIIYAKPSLPIPAILLTLFLIVFLGTRPSSFVFGDSYFYEHTYNNYVDDYEFPNLNSEWLWNNMNTLSKNLGFEVHDFFLVVTVLYFGLMLLCCWRLFPNNTWIAVLFFFDSYSCYTYGVNGIRNGLGTSIVLLAVTFLTEKDWRKFVSIPLMLIVYGIHHSTMLPSAAALTAAFVIKEPKYAIRFWIASIFISLTMGNAVGDFFASLGFDDRMSSYFQGQEDTVTMSKFSDTGFRFDFLLYSAMPVLMAWYVTVKRNFKDRAFNIIANTYILANAFWVMVIRASYSNRFAYLSWFIYPLVIAYPLLRMNIWEDQDRKTAWILLAYSGFTFFMFLIGK